jgi:hypothetical protein
MSTPLPITYLVKALIWALLFFALYSLLAVIQYGAPIKAEWWVRDFYVFKDDRAQQLPAGKIIVAAGSNALFSTNSTVLADTTGRPVANLATHAGLSLEFYREKVLQHVAAGDIVLMPLESPYYQSSGRPSGWFASNMLAWGWQDYLQYQSPLALLSNVPYLGWQRLLQGLSARFSGRKPPLSDPLAVLEQVAQVGNPAGAWHELTVKSLNRVGDINIQSAPTRGVLNLSKTGVEYFSQDSQTSDYFLKFMRQFKAEVEARGARLFLTWPVMMRNPAFDLQQAVHRQRLSALRADLLEQGVPIICAARSAQFGVRYFFNSPYHLNAMGAKRRSRRLGQCVNSVLAQAPPSA